MFASADMATAYVQIFGSKVWFGGDLKAEVFLLVKFQIHIQVIVGVPITLINLGTIVLGDSPGF